jgi:hypothetical protein
MAGYQPAQLCEQYIAQLLRESAGIAAVERSLVIESKLAV